MTVHRRNPSLRTALAACAIALTAYGVIAPAPAAAQDVSREIQNLKRDLADLQRYVYRGQTGPAPTTLAPSQDSANPGGEALSGDVAARLQVRIQELERRLRDTTGKVEEVQFKMRQMEQRLETAMQDIEYRLTRLEGGNPAPPRQSGSGTPSSGAVSGGGTGAQPVIPVPGSGTTIISSSGAENASGGTVATQGGLQGGTLGTLIVDAQGNVVGGQANPQATQGSTPLAPSGSNTGAAPSIPSTVQSAAPVEGGDIASAGANATASLPSEPQALYDFSLGLMRQGDYAEAESALQVFLDKHAEHSLASSALYWLGETHYVRNNYRDAAFSFVDVYSRFPKSPKAPDSLLKLGMSLHALGNKAEACSALSTLQTEYPNARRAVLKLAEDRGAQYGC
ncbi:MAG: tol-pal system protein YbgF [Alphaproteobacteria bacterium]|jgi:tol-pal system protein YbgF|uniref:tol-pal system protein YbgF n=1 Tax=Pacificispira sp. TaxID=2888761 RepID=UPI001B1D1AD0|nr:tol-pal system protein YbgF [Alphaproteobacteria bacterium]MBO6862267.1 tol-pal system protein YbgF [Alphaproteobacteria bacterium]MEC9266099.1 tol-pal system protein YbgF [Pseudomonadota bacterium]